jgi:hypothetical protein
VISQRTPRVSEKAAGVLTVGLRATVIGSHFAAWYCTLIILSVLLNYPGRASPDSLDMIQQSRNLASLNDWHSPFVTWFWSLLDVPLGQPAGALLIQCLLLFSWPALLLARWSQKRFAFYRGLVVLGLTVVLVPVAGAVTKDTVLIAFTSGMFCVLEASGTADFRQLRQRTRLVSCALLAGIVLIRPSNFIILILAFLLLAALHPYYRRPARAMLVLGILTASPILSIAVNKVLLGAASSHAENALILFDIAGISTAAKKDIFAKLPGWPENELKPWDCYTPKQADPFLWGPCRAYGTQLGGKIAELGDTGLLRWWVTAILTHPLAYIAHRASFVQMLLTRDGSGNEIIVPPRPAYDFAANHPRLLATMPPEYRKDILLWQPRVAYAPFGFAADAFFRSSAGSPLLWVGGCFAIAGFLVARRAQTQSPDQICALAAGLGLGNFVMLAIFSGSDDCRYLLMTLLCLGVAAARLTLHGPPHVTRPAVSD